MTFQADAQRTPPQIRKPRPASHRVRRAGTGGQGHRRVVGLALLLGFGTLGAWAQEGPAAVTLEELRRLQESIRQLQQQNQQLLKRIEELEAATPRQTPVAPPAPAPALPESAPAAPPETNRPPAKADHEIKWSWKNGLSFETGDRRTFKGKLGGRLQLDLASFSESQALESAPGIGDLPAGVEFRRVRLALEGEYAASLPAFYKVEMDFAEAEVAFKDVYLGLADLPAIGTIRAGHFREPSSLEGQTSSRFLTFLERAAPVEAFWPERNTGVALGNAVLDGRATWSLGAFTSTELRGGVENGQPLDSDYRIVGRLTGLPFYDANGARLLHVGVSGTFAAPEKNQVRFRARPEAHLAPRFVDTGVIGADRHYMLNAEAAFVWGPWSLQGEYFYNWVDQPLAGTAEFSGYYVAGSWLLTGEHRNYKTAAAAFDRLSPKRNLSLHSTGFGAWEVAVRYSHLDLNDAGIRGGDLRDLTGGVNWYLNPNMKLQFNYVYSLLDRTIAGVNYDGHAHIFETRWHVDF